VEEEEDEDEEDEDEEEKEEWDFVACVWRVTSVCESVPHTRPFFPFPERGFCVCV